MQVSKEQLQLIEDLVSSVGQFQLEHFRSMPSQTGNRKAAKETVSFVDIESEKKLKQGLFAVLPEAGFFGEETGKSGSQDLVWVVDPLDGTTNFLSGLDYFSISVALVYQGNPIAGVVHRPATKDTFTSLKGQGVWHNQAACKAVSPEIKPSEALFATGFPYRSEDLVDSFFKTAKQVLSLGLGIRRSGSAALDLAHLAAGWYHGFWESDLQAYDVAAAVLMLEENGVILSNQYGEPYHLFDDRILVAAFPQVHPALLHCVQEAYV